MGKIIKDGFTFMEYANAGLIRKVDDIPELKTRLITLSESKTHHEMSRYAVLLAEHILEMSKTRRTPEINECIAVNQKWQRGEVQFQQARDVAGIVNGLAREEKDPIRVKVLRGMGQVAATPHVKWHCLVASEFAVVVVNLLHPGNMDEVKRERETQLMLMGQL